MPNSKTWVMTLKRMTGFAKRNRPAGKQKPTCAHWSRLAPHLAPIEREIDGLETQLQEQDAELARLTKAHDDAAAQFAAAEAGLPDAAEAETNLHDIQEKENMLRLEVGAARQKVNVLDTLKERLAGFE